MTKRQMHQKINTKFFMFIEKKFPQYDIDDSEGFGRVYLFHENGFDSIEYHLSRHEVVGFSYNSAQSKNDEDIMRKFLEKLVAHYNL